MSRRSILVFSLALAACAVDTTVDLEDFDRSCAADQDCALVFANVCGCSCEQVAVRSSEEARYNDELGAKAESCEYLTCAACPEVQRVAVCKEAVCTVK